MATAAALLATTVGPLVIDLGGTAIVGALKVTYHVAGAFNDFLNEHIANLRSSDIPMVERSGRVLEGAKAGFGIGYVAPVIVIAAGQALLGNPLSAAAAVGSALTLTNPVAMTCAAIGAVAYGYGALSPDERDALLLKLGHGLSVGVELIRSVIGFAVEEIRRLLSSQQMAEIKKYVREYAEVFGKHLSEVTGLIADKLSDGYRAVVETSGWAASTLAEMAGSGASHLVSATATVGAATRDGVAAGVGEVGSALRRAVNSVKAPAKSRDTNGDAEV